MRPSRDPRWGDLVGGRGNMPGSRRVSTTASNSASAIRDSILGGRGRASGSLPVATVTPTRRGSEARGGNTIVASGAGPTSVAAGGSTTFTVSIVEDVILDKLVIQAETLVPLSVSDIKIDNDGLLNGSCPADMFAKDSLHSPYFGHLVTKNSTVQVTVANGDSTDASLVSVGFSAAPVAIARG